MTPELASCFAESSLPSRDGPRGIQPRVSSPSGLLEDEAVAASCPEERGNNFTHDDVNKRLSPEWPNGRAEDKVMYSTTVAFMFLVGHALQISIKIGIVMKVSPINKRVWRHEVAHLRIAQVHRYIAREHCVQHLLGDPAWVTGIFITNRESVPLHYIVFPFHASAP